VGVGVGVCVCVEKKEIEFVEVTKLDGIKINAGKEKCKK